jgi:esterase/lipase superfamily enzyme
MTRYVSFRSDAVGGPVIAPLLLEGGAGGLTRMSEQQLAAAIAGKNLLFAAHGFNVNLATGVRQCEQLERQLGLPANAASFGVLWPGDFVIPVINYPFEAQDAVQCGRRLAALCNDRLGAAASFSFMSHSLGGRLVLEAVARLSRKAKAVCLTAAAVDRDALTRQYSAALRNSESVAVLSSVRDRVLQYAYPGGDFLSDIFGDGDSPFRSALGLRGPRPGAGPTVVDSRIPRALNCDHGDYMPQGPQWQNVAGYVSRCFQNASQVWP